MRVSHLLLIGVCCICGPLPAVPVQAQTPTRQTIDFNRQIRPILSNRCLACHGPDEGQRQSGLRLDEVSSSTRPLESGHTAVVPGQPDRSELLRRVLSSDADIRMPPPEFGAPLTADEQALLREWIQQGAPFARHWSYVPPERPAVPAPAATYSSWPRNPIDHFVLQQLASRQLQPAAQADAQTLVRRVFLDLTGLPPTLDEARDWSARLQTAIPDTSSSPPVFHADVWSQLIDHLMSRPEFGEHWARKWLDLARYADSAGYADDPARTIWPWRDWVIRAISSGMPFDQFTVEQLAGDLLPNPTEDQIIATGFHRNTMTNNEGGTQDEEFRNVAVVDRVNTTMAVWMGTTFACAQCHSHKYDPITQEEYFKVFAILNNTEDADRGDDSPKLQLFTPEQKSRRSELTSRLAQLKTLLETPTPELIRSQSAWEQRLRVPAEWARLKAAAARRNSGQPITLDENGIVFLNGPADKDSTLVEIPLESLARIPQFAEQGLAAVQLETLPSEQLPAGGAGYGGGNFVITEIRAQLLPAGDPRPAARFVRIDLPGDGKILSLAEVQVFSNVTNVASAGTATQSSTDFAGPAQLAIDNTTDGNYEKKSVTHTAVSKDPWWELDLNAALPVEKITVWNRTGNGIHTRLAGAIIRLLDADRREIWSATIAEAPNPSVEFNPGNQREIRFVAAAADYSQPAFNPEEVLDGRTEPDNGWAVGGDAGRSHNLTLIPDSPIPVREGGTLRLVLEQNSPYAAHLLGRFQLNGSAHPAAIERAQVPAGLLAVIQQPVEQRSSEDSAALADFFRRNAASELAAARSEIAALQKEFDSMQPGASVLVMKELTPDRRRKTLLQYRGNYLDRGPEVHEGVPAIFPPLSPDQPANRLTLARWLVSPQNPLTARVVANRYWEDIFGRGIVGTSEEFGSQGELPTHPELLDWLAVELQDSAWNTRHLLKLLVSSATYLQSARVSPELAALDPDNRWLSRGPRVRLSSEMVRDQTLAVAGLLSRKMYGPPVKPPQPSMGLSAAFGSSTDWQTSMGEDRYRRAIYTTWRRSNPYPSMATFDAPNREVCTLRRNRTNTPLQALVTLNDPVYVEAAQALARRILQQPGDDQQRLAWAFEQALLRQPSAAELQSLSLLLTDARSEAIADPAAAAKLATEPLGTLPEGLSPTDAAAFTVVGNVILNLDEMLMKR
ncbi:MAG: DUF1553 domain-containing protein [Planctomycetaceae bacterium]